MRVRMLRTVSNRKFGGLLREGIVLTVPDRQAQDWMRQTPPICEEFVDRRPPRNAALDAAPKQKDGDGPPVASTEPERTKPARPSRKKKDEEDRPTKGRRTGGKGKRSSAQPRGRRSRKKT